MTTAVLNCPSTNATALAVNLIREKGMIVNVMYNEFIILLNIILRFSRMQNVPIEDCCSIDPYQYLQNGESILVRTYKQMNLHAPMFNRLPQADIDMFKKTYEDMHIAIELAYKDMIKNTVLMNIPFFKAISEFQCSINLISFNHETLFVRVQQDVQ